MSFKSLRGVDRELQGGSKKNITFISNLPNIKSINKSLKTYRTKRTVVVAHSRIYIYIYIFIFIWIYIYAYMLICTLPIHAKRIQNHRRVDRMYTFNNCCPHRPLYCCIGNPYACSLSATNMRLHVCWELWLASCVSWFYSTLKSSKHQWSWEPRCS